MYRAAVITLIDKGAAGLRADMSGPAAARMLEETEEYMIEENSKKKYSAQFEYQEVHYQLTGIMTREQMEEILNNLYFL